MQIQIQDFGIFDFDPQEAKKKYNDSYPKGYIYYFNPHLPLVANTTKIPLKNNVAFGLRFYTFHPLNPLTVKIIHPEIENPEQLAFTETNFPLEVIIGEQVALYVLEYKWEMVPGFWTVQIWNGHQLLLEKEFEVYVTDIPMEEEEENYFYDL